MKWRWWILAHGMAFVVAFGLLVWLTDVPPPPRTCFDLYPDWPGCIPVPFTPLR